MGLLTRILGLDKFYTKEECNKLFFSKNTPQIVITVESGHLTTDMGVVNNVSGHLVAYGTSGALRILGEIQL